MKLLVLSWRSNPDEQAHKYWAPSRVIANKLLSKKYQWDSKLWEVLCWKPDSKLQHPLQPLTEAAWIYYLCWPLGLWGSFTLSTWFGALTDSTWEFVGFMSFLCRLIYSKLYEKTQWVVIVVMRLFLFVEMFFNKCSQSMWKGQGIKKKSFSYVKGLFADYLNWNRQKVAKF